MTPWQRLGRGLDALDRRSHYTLRRALGVLLIALFLGALCLLLYLWFRLMQPYAE
jgi:hypothetical protein